MSAVLRLCAFLAREAAGLDDDEHVVLEIGAEGLRKMALAALKERDELKLKLRRHGDG